MHAYPHPHKQQGAILVIGMILLAILMLGATSLMNSTIMDERLAGNSKASAEAFFAAEAGYLQALEHLEPEDVNNPGELDLALAKGRWMELEDQLKDFDTPEKWDNRNSQPKVPAALVKADNSKHEFTLSIAPVFEQEVDADGVTKTVRAEHKVQFASNGTFGTAGRAIGFNLDGGGLFGGLPPAPAAISCFGACKIIAGTASDAPISGRNHPVPKDGFPDEPYKHCKGTGNGPSTCDVDPYSPLDNDPDNDIKHHFSVPSVYLTDADKSSISIGKDKNQDDGSDKDNGKGNGKDKDSGNANSGTNNKKLAFEGQDKDKKYLEDADQYHTAGSDITAGSVWYEKDFEGLKDSEGNPTKPDPKTYFGEDGLTSSLLEKAGDKLGTVNSNTVTLIDTAKTTKLDMDSAGGVLIVDGPGKELSATGTGIFSGLIIIIGCNSWSSSGNITVYGAIIVDAEGCEPGYTPFTGNGTPDVKYSQDALNNAGAGLGLGKGLGVTDDWYEIVGQ